jgi:HlyD family secretion protein
MRKLLSVSGILLIFILTACDGSNDGNIEASGNIEATNIIVSSQVSGEVIRILIDEGGMVEKGDTVMIIDPELYELRLQEATASVEFAEAQLKLLQKGARSEDVNQAKENLRQAKISFQLAEKDKERMENLYQSKTVTKKEYDNALANFKINLARLNAASENLNKIENLSRPEELKQAEANVKRAIANLNLIKKNIDDCYVVSPSEGFISRKFIEEGETAGLMSSLFQVADLSSVELVIYVRETELGKLKLGQQAEISIDTYPGKIYRGKVIYISPEAEFTPKNIQTQEERTKLVFAVKIQIDNPDFELKDGMPADASIITNLQD